MYQLLYFIAAIVSRVSAIWVSMADINISSFSFNSSAIATDSVFIKVVASSTVNEITSQKELLIVYTICVSVDTFIK